ncbi:MAG: proton-conducting membrane transporter [Wenzhouxiangellaceae bacterium]|nr:proton-conducting membrane transporter [Wenzhouxiangellaceae bacterium]
MIDWPHWLPLLAVLPLVGGVLTPLLFHRLPNAACFWAASIAALTLAVGVALLVRLLASGGFGYAVGGWLPQYGIELRFDEIGALAVAAGFIALLSLVFSRHYVARAVDPDRAPLYYALVLINLGGLNGFLVTGDLFNLFVFMEIFSVSAYALVAMARAPIAALAALKYLLLGALSSLLVLFSVGVVFAMTGTLNIEDAAVLLDASSAMPAGLALAGLATGFAVKAALFPVHFWLPDAHAAAPAPVSAILSALVVKAGVVGLLRTLELFAGGDDLLQPLLTLIVWLGALGALGGALMALVQRDIKRMLAYSTVANIGYIFIGLGLATASAVSGAMVHSVNHAVMKSALFLAAGAIIHRTGLRNIDDLRGLGRRMPITAFGMAVALIALSGVPPAAGFVGKWQIALGALEAGQPWLVAVLVVAGIVVLAFGVRVINALYFRPPARVPVASAIEVPASMWLPVLLLAVASLALGLAGTPMLAFVGPAVQSVYGTIP